SRRSWRGFPPVVPAWLDPRGLRYRPHGLTPPSASPPPWPPRSRRLRPAPSHRPAREQERERDGSDREPGRPPERDLEALGRRVRRGDGALEDDGEHRCAERPAQLLPDAADDARVRHLVARQAL